MNSFYTSIRCLLNRISVLFFLELLMLHIWTIMTTYAPLIAHVFVCWGIILTGKLSLNVFPRWSPPILTQISDCGIPFHCSCLCSSSLLRKNMTTSTRLRKKMVAAMHTSPLFLTMGRSLAVYAGSCVAMNFLMLFSDSRHTPKVFSQLLSERSLLQGSATSVLMARATPVTGAVERMPAACSNRSCSEDDSLLNPATSWALAPPSPPEMPSVTCWISDDLLRWVVFEALSDGVCAWVRVSNTCGLPLQPDLISTFPSITLDRTMWLATLSPTSPRSFLGKAISICSQVSDRFKVRTGDCVPGVADWRCSYEHVSSAHAGLELLDSRQGLACRSHISMSSCPSTCQLHHRRRLHLTRAMGHYSQDIWRHQPDGNTNKTNRRFSCNMGRELRRLQLMCTDRRFPLHSDRWIFSVRAVHLPYGLVLPRRWPPLQIHPCQTVDVVYLWTWICFIDIMCSGPWHVAVLPLSPFFVFFGLPLLLFSSISLHSLQLILACGFHCTMGSQPPPTYSPPCSRRFNNRSHFPQIYLGWTLGSSGSRSILKTD